MMLHIYLFIYLYIYFSGSEYTMPNCMTIDE